MSTETMHGVVPILVTPFTPDGTIDVESLRSVVEFNLNAGVHGLGIALASEVFKLSEAERDQVASIVVDLDKALAVANDTDFGLCAGICTTRLKTATVFRRKPQTGMLMVDLPTAGVDYHVPFGGREGSSHGPHEQGSYAAEFYTTVKTAYIAP
jgi:hypothetical protein